MSLLKKFIAIVLLVLFGTLKTPYATEEQHPWETMPRELWQYISQAFLTEDALATARLVNKKWRDIFTLPYAQGRCWRPKLLADIPEILKHFGLDALKTLSFQHILFLDVPSLYTIGLPDSLENLDMTSLVQRPRDITRLGLGQLTRLTSLKLPGFNWIDSDADQVASEAINSLSTLKKITSLRVRRDVFNDKRGDLVKALPHIQALSVSHISEVISGSGVFFERLSGWTRLEKLELEDIQSCHCKGLGVFTNLTDLSLKRVPYLHTLPAEIFPFIAQNVRLRSLTFSTLKDPTPDTFKHLLKCTQLTYLCIGATVITTDFCEIFPQLPHLVSLTLHELQLSDALLKTISHCSKLQYLTLNMDILAVKKEVTSSGFSALGSLTNLTYLHLFNVYIDDLSGLLQMPHLKNLILRNSHDLSFKGQHDACVLPSLTRLEASRSWNIEKIRMPALKSLAWGVDLNDAELLKLLVAYPSLKELEISGQLTITHLESFVAGVKTLWRLNLRRCRIFPPETKSLLHAMRGHNIKGIGIQ